MAEVFELPPPVVLRAAGRPYARIQRVSRVLAALFTAVLIAGGVFAGLVILNFIVPFAGDRVGIGRVGMVISLEGPVTPPYIPITAVPLWQRLAHVPVGLLHTAPLLGLLWNLRQLFGLYGRGVVFARENAWRIKWVGVCLVLIASTPLAGYLFLASLGLAIDRNWLHLSSLQELVLGAIVYVVAQVMEAGREIEQERDQFV